MSEPASIWNHYRGLQTLSLCDWPGRSCCVVFLGGCNLRCPTCHNFALAWDMDSQPKLPRAGLLSFLKGRRAWLDGVTVSGGEATCAPGLGELLWEIKRLEFPIKVDTNGMRPDVVEECLAEGLADHFAVDVKGPFALYPALTGNGVTAEEARANLTRLFALAEDRPEAFSFRLTTVPALSREDIETARGCLPRKFSLTLQPFRQPRSAHAFANHEERRPARDLVHG